MIPSLNPNPIECASNCIIIEILISISGVQPIDDNMFSCIDFDFGLLRNSGFVISLSIPISYVQHIDVEFVYVEYRYRFLTFTLAKSICDI